jgi:hypothetical protein
MATHRITKHADNRFTVEVRNKDDLARWHTTGEFSTWRQADAEKARLQKLAAVPEAEPDSE